MTNTPIDNLRLVLWLGVALLLALLVRPYIEALVIQYQAEPRAVTARGELAEGEQNAIEIFEGVSPSVVYITTLTEVVDLWSRNVTQMRQGTGSGFIWDEQGHVVTNYHVIKRAHAAQVRLADQRTYSAVLVGASSNHDLAILRINVAFRQPPPVPIGTSADLKVGQKVFAIGNPFGLDHTLTTGVVSALDRSIGTDGGGSIYHLIQTDAAINPGNSGGPLIDSAGRLIGINTAIYSPSGAYAGIGFAVPVDTVNRVVPELIAYGKYERPSLGVVVDDEVGLKITSRLGVEGVLVLRVQPGSGAESSGLRSTRVTADGRVVPGDVIQKVDGRMVKEFGDLGDILEEHGVGDQVILTVWRDGSVLQIPALLD